MSEAHQPLPAAISSNDEPTIPESKQAVSPELPDKTVTAPAVNYNGHIKPQPQPGRRNAIFSTDLGRRAPRGSQQPRFFQSVARSNLEEDVVVAAGYLRKKYPYQYLSILPHQGWHISDLWDDYDIQIEGEKYFTQVLKVIEKHNATQVPRFACEYAEKHPERLALIGGNITGLYDKAHPVSIVDKIFVNEESRDYPPSFLWKVAIVLRTNMLAVRAMTEASKDLAGAPVSSNVDEKDTLVHSAEYASSSAAVPTEAAFSPSTPSKGEILIITIMRLGLTSIQHQLLLSSQHPRRWIRKWLPPSTARDSSLVHQQLHHLMVALALPLDMYQDLATTNRWGTQCPPCLYIVRVVQT